MPDIFDNSDLQHLINNPLSQTKDIQALAEAFIYNPCDLTFTKLVNRIEWALRGYIYKIVKTNEATDDVLSLTLERIYFKRDKFNPSIANFSTWAFTIARNTSINYIRNGGLTQNDCVSQDFEDLYESCLDASSSDASSMTVSHSDMPIDIAYEGGEFITYSKEKVLNDIYEAIVNCIDQLPDNLRIVMRERLLESKSMEKIAEDNSVPLSSVKNWIRKGKEMLKVEMEDRYKYLYDLYQNFDEVF